LAQTHRSAGGISLRCRLWERSLTANLALLGARLDDRCRAPFVVVRVPGIEVYLSLDLLVVDLTLFDVSPKIEATETRLRWNSCDREERNESREEVEPHGW
jgi:hypothetical protein